ncbi:MlaA family lipoprotein, partial [Aggregatibacter actinomycetemcomitans]
GFLKAGLQSIDTRAKLIDKEALLDQAQDPYVAFREAYFQNLDQRINESKGKQADSELSQDILNQIN